MGMKDSKLIVAINTDRAAPIFRLADIGILADLHHLLPALVQELRQVKAAQETDGERP
jgi:electron transfer flavoprotein alpha subunit